MDYIVKKEIEGEEPVEFEIRSLELWFLLQSRNISKVFDTVKLLDENMLGSTGFSLLAEDGVEEFFTIRKLENT